MTVEDSGASVAIKIRQSIEREGGRRRVRFFRLRDQFGFRVWSAGRKKLVAGLLADQGITCRPLLTQVSLDDWIVLVLDSKNSSDDHPQRGPLP